MFPQRVISAFTHADVSKNSPIGCIVWRSSKLVDVLVLDLGIVGFTRWRQLMPELAKAGIKASPHL